MKLLFFLIILNFSIFFKLFLEILKILYKSKQNDIVKKAFLFTIKFPSILIYRFNKKNPLLSSIFNLEGYINLVNKKVVYTTEVKKDEVVHTTEVKKDEVVHTTEVKKDEVIQHIENKCSLETPHLPKEIKSNKSTTYYLFSMIEEINQAVEGSSISYINSLRERNRSSIVNETNNSNKTEHSFLYDSEYVQEKMPNCYN